MAIKDPTAAVFRRQTGSNLLIIGQDENAGVAVMTGALVSLASQHCPTGEQSTAANFYILDATPADAPHAGYFSRLSTFIPHSIELSGWRACPALLTKLATETDRRQKSNGIEGPEIYFLINGLHRFRDLRLNEDDFGYSQTEATASPAKNLALVVREGPGLDIH